MGKPRKEPTPEQLETLRRQIREWRETRKVPGSMPEEIWTAAAVLARKFGVCPMARALTLDYSALRKRAEKLPETGLVKPTFFRLPATVVPTAPPPTTIEISARDGSRMLIHLEAGHGTEAASIVAAFLGSRG